MKKYSFPIEKVIFYYNKKGLFLKPLYIKLILYRNQVVACNMT